MRLLALFLLILATPALPFVQEPQTPRTGTAPESAGRANASRADAILAGWLLVDSNNEVALARIAQQKAQDPDVKKFAQKMIDDHGQMGQKLAPFASTVGFAGAARASGSPDTKDRTGEGRPVEAGFGSDGDLDHVALIEELGEQCLSSTRKVLEEKSGAEFDRCYMGTMVGAHMKANDMLTVFQRHASSELKSVLANGQKTIAMHLQHAKDLSKELEGRADAKPKIAGEE